MDSEIYWPTMWKTAQVRSFNKSDQIYMYMYVHVMLNAELCFF